MNAAAEAAATQRIAGLLRRTGSRAVAAGKAIRRPGRPSCSTRCRMRLRCRSSRPSVKTAAASAAVDGVDFGQQRRQDRAPFEARFAGGEVVRIGVTAWRRAGRAEERHLEQAIVGEVPLAHTSVHTTDLSTASSLRSLRTARKQMHPDRGLAQSEFLAHFGGALLGNVAERKHRALAVGQLIDRRGDLAAALARHQELFLCRPGRDRFVRWRLGRACQRQDPAQPPAPRLPQVEAAVHQDAREPDLEGQVLAIRGDVRKDLDERVLHRLVGILRVAQVVIGDAYGPALLAGDQVAKPLARCITLSGDDQRLDGARQLGILRQGGSRRAGRVGRAG